MPHTKGVNVPLNVMFNGLTGKSKGNLNEVVNLFTKSLAKIAKPLGINIDTKSIQTLKDLEKLVSNLGISIQRTGKQFSVMMENSSGMSAIGNISAAEKKGKTYFKRQSTTYSSSRLSPTQQLNRDYDNVIKATKELNKLESQGLKGSQAWKTQEANLNRYNEELQITIDKYKEQFKLKTQIDDRLGNKEVLAGEGSLAKTQRKREFELKSIKDTHQSQLLNSQETKKANQSLQEYVATSNKLISAKEKLYKMETEGYYQKPYSKEEIQIQKDYIADLENRKSSLEKGAQASEDYANAQEKIKNSNNTLETTTKRLIEQQAQRNIGLQQQQQKEQAEAKAHQENTQKVREYVSALKEQWEQENKLATLKKSKAPQDQINQQQKVVKMATDHTNALKNQVKGTKEYVEVEKQLEYAQEKQNQKQLELNQTTKKSTSLFGNFKNTLKQVISAGLSWKIFSAITNTLKDVQNTVIDLDKNLVDLQIVTGSTREEAKKMLSTYSQMAQELGATTQEVATAAVEWQRQGYTIAQTNTLIKNSMILSKVGMIESAEAQEYLTSAMKGFNVSVQNSLGIVDKLASVDLEAVI